MQGASAQELDELHDVILRLSDELIDEINAQRVLAAAESQELVVHPVSVNAIGLLQEVMGLYARHEVAADRHLAIDPRAWDGSLVSDRTLVRRVVGNMTKNALEAARPGETITLGCEIGEDGVDFLVHNPGFIPPDVQLQIFQRSFSTKGTGRGLGTYSIKLLTERYLQGSVSFSTAPEDGTTFRARCRTMSTPEGEPDAAEANAIPSLRILLAEDNPVNQKIVVALLERAGHSVSIAGNGKEAVEKQESEAFDLVLMDVHMPEMDGLEATAEIRGRERKTGAHVPVLALTAAAMAGDQERCLAAGMDGCLHKPIRVDELSEAIGRMRTQPSEVGADRPAVAHDDEAPFDLKEALARAAGDRDLLVELADLFLDNCPEFLSEVRSAVGSRDAQALERSAHKLKGSVGNFGARPAFDAAFRLEEIGRVGDLQDAVSCFEILEREIGRFRSVLEAFVGQDGS
ncbi:MAG: response regulator [Candidatus Latescibacteria bacterium]|nr:response regulator [Candidatus Latescibacterota bacterium]